jgi:hypothetical protein
MLLTIARIDSPCCSPARIGGQGQSEAGEGPDRSGESGADLGEVAAAARRRSRVGRPGFLRRGTEAGRSFYSRCRDTCSVPRSTIG